MTFFAKFVLDVQGLVFTHVTHGVSVFYECVAAIGADGTPKNGSFVIRINYGFFRVKFDVFWAKIAQKFLLTQPNHPS